MNVEEEVRSRRLDAVVEEALGNGVPADLEERVLQRVRGVEAAPRRAWSAVAAITLLAGVLVVALVAWLRSSRDGVAPLQDPQKADAPAVIDLAAPSVVDAKAIDAWPSDAVVRVFGIARAADADIVITGALEGESHVALRGLTWREAVEAIAIEKKVGLSEFGATLLVGVGAVPTARPRATFGSDVILAIDALKVLHARGGANFVVAADRLGRRVRLNVRDRPWRTVIDAVAAAVETRVVGRGNVLALVRNEAPRPTNERVEPAEKACEFTGPATFGDAIGGWALRAQSNVFIGKRVEATILRFALGPDEARGGIFALAEAAHADVPEAHPLLRIEPRLANDTGITLTAEAMSLRDLVMMSWMTQQPNVAIADGVDAKITVLVANALWFDVLRAAAVAAGRQFVRTEKGYRIE